MWTCRSPVVATLAVVGVRRLVGDLPRGDVVLAGALCAVKVGFVLTSTLMSSGSKPTALLCAVLLTLPLAWRRTSPLAVALIIAAVIAGDDLAAGWNGAVLSFDCSIIAAYSAGGYARQPRAITALAALLAANVVDAVGAPGDLAGNLALGIVVFSVVPWLVGQALRRERRRTAELQTLTRTLVAERQEMARLAVAAERGRIARELHDVVAHAVSVIAIQADAAMQILDHDPSRARGPLQSIQETARGALVEMRRLVGLLRDDDDHPAFAPAPGLASLDELVDEVRRSGVPVTLDITGDPRALAPTLDLTAYRVVQEGLTNVLKHAGEARAHVTIAYHRDELALEVRDQASRHDGVVVDTTPVESGGGHGLVGLRERVVLLSGQMESGATADGFVLRVRLPVGRHHEEQPEREPA
jgi:signal transduction histidine kinase